MRPGLRVSSRLVIEDNRAKRPFTEAVDCQLRSKSPPTLVGCRGNQVTPGLYQLDLFGLAPEVYVQSVTAGGHDVLREGLKVQSDTELEVLLGTPGSTVQGTVRRANGDKVSDAVVALVPDAPLRNAGPLYRSVISDVNGNFELRGIAPGAYHLFAWPELEGAAYRNAEFMKEFEGRGKPVVIEKGTRLSMDVTAF